MLGSLGGTDIDIEQMSRCLPSYKQLSEGPEIHEVSSTPIVEGAVLMNSKSSSLDSLLPVFGISV